MNFSTVDPSHVYAYDIETAGNDKAPAFWSKFAATACKAPSTWKDTDKIKAREEENLAKLRSKDALSWFTGKIVSIAFVNVGDCLKHMDNIDKAVASGKIRSFAICGFDEKQVLLAASTFLNTGANGVFQLVGKNSSTFDDGFLIGRFMVNDLPIPRLMRNSYNLMDIDLMICGSRASSQTGSLNKYSFALGMDSKLMSGDMVPKMYKEAVVNKLAEKNDKVVEIMTKIKEYNLDDTKKTAFIAAKLMRD